ncbi:MAG: helix-turn-helix domain-containing protein [Ruminococcus sp.]|nr:helix-turn-helix domain-containing protein [Ruminococcus sp.]
MADRSKREIVDAITALLTELIEQDERSVRQAEVKKESEPVEMLTVRECADQIKGLTENTVRQLVKQDKLPHIRSGRGERGKILIKKSDLYECISKMTSSDTY